MSTVRQVRLAAMTAAAFAPFGQVLDSPGGMSRRDFAATLTNRRPSARPNLALVRAPLVTLPMIVRQMERHPCSNQAFMPLDVSEYLVIVAPDDGAEAPRLDAALAFRVPGTQGINYEPGIWHCGMMVLGGAGLFAMLVFEDGSPDDTHFRPIEPVELLFEASGVVQPG